MTVANCRGAACCAPTPFSNTSRISRSGPGTPVRSAAARPVVTSTRTCPDNSSSSVSTRSPAISKCGSSAPSASRCGYSATADPDSVRRSASHRSASVGVGVITTNTRCASRRASAATSTAGLEPGRPEMPRRVPGAGNPSANARVAGSASNRSITKSSGISGYASRPPAPRARRPGPAPAAARWHRDAPRRRTGRPRTPWRRAPPHPARRARAPAAPA